MGNIRFWENNNCSGDTRNFGGTNFIDDLSEWTYDDSKKEMDDSISSLQSDAGAWVFVFSQHSYEGEVLRVDPSSTIDDLGDSREFPGTGDDHGFANTIVSFAQYASQPNFWATNNTTSLGNCWVKFYLDTRYNPKLLVPATGSGVLTLCYAIVGAGDCLNARCITNYVCYDASIGDGTETNYAKSLTTGPETWVKLYKDINFQNPIGQFGPNAIVPDLSDYGADEMMSFQVYDAEPEGWNGSTSTTPAEVMTIQRYQTGDKVEKLLAGVLSCIPYVGGLAKGILGALWPSSPDVQTVWYDLDSYMTSLFDSLLAQVEESVLNDDLEGIATLLTEYTTLEPGSGKVDQLNAIINALGTDKGYFINSDKPQETLNYMVEYGTICVLMLAERAFNYTTISGGVADPDAAPHAQDLDTAITNLTNDVNNAQANALTWRTSLITNVETGSISTNYVVTDGYTGFSTEYSTQQDADSAYSTLVDSVTTQYTNVLNAKCSPTFLWAYLRPSNTTTVADSGNSNFPTTQFKTLPQQQTINLTTGTFGQATGTYFSDLSNGHAITGIKLYSTDNYLCGIQLVYSGQNSSLHGSVGPSTLGPYSATANFEDGEAIVGLYGGSGSWMDQLFVRTIQAPDDGPVKSRDVGVGGNGGSSYMAAPPQGMGAVITQVEGYVGTYINQLTFHWAYTIWK